MTTKLHISPDLALPLDAVTQKLAFLARTGAGKTYAAMKLCEEMLAAGAQVVALDPVGVWYGLRLAADGRGTGFLIPVFGGEHGDVPLEPKAGALVADLVVDRGLSCVLDVSMFESKAQHKQFATDFAERLFYRKKSARSPLHLFLEEAQEFVPQFKSRGEERMLGAFERLIKLGRNYGLGASLISQRPQAVNKDVLNQTECLFALQTTGPQERKAIEGWIHEKGLDEDIAGTLPKLSIGEAHVWSPAWLGISETVKIGKKKTFDASATPTFGAKAERPRELSPVDVDEIRRSMADVVARAEENDPAKLKRQIAALQRELEKAQAAKPEVTVDRVIEVPAVSGELAFRLHEQLDELGRILNRFESAAEAMRLTGLDVRGALQSVGQNRALVGLQHVVANTTSTYKPVHTPRPRKESPARDPSSDGEVTRAWQVLLDGLAWYATVGLATVTRNQLAAFVGQAAEGGAFQNKLGAMRTAGLIDYPGGGLVSLTEAGRGAANFPESRPTLAQLHSSVQGFLPPAQWKLLKLLIDIYPEETTREGLARAAGEVATGGAFQNKLGRLRTLGFIDYPRQGHVEATDLLFPEGLN